MCSCLESTWPRTFYSVVGVKILKDLCASEKEKNSWKTKERKGAKDECSHLNLFTLKSGQSKNSTKFLISFCQDAEKTNSTFTCSITHWCILLVLKTLVLNYFIGS